MVFETNRLKGDFNMNYLRGTDAGKFATDILLTVSGIALVKWLFTRKNGK